MQMLSDIRFAIRGFRRNLGLTVVTVLVLGLGIGANTAIFSVVDALVLRPLPLPSPDELVAVPHGLMYLNYLDVRKQSRSFRGLAVYHAADELLPTAGASEVVNTVSASAELFSVLGVQPMLGRTFLPGEDDIGRPPLAVLSYDLWQRHLNGDPHAIGSSFWLDGRTVTVIGVMPPAFRFPLDEPSGDAWVTLGSAFTFREQRQWRGYQAYRCIGRLAAGVSISQARADVAGIAAELTRLYPRESEGRTIDLAPYDALVKTGRSAFLIVLAAVGLVLLIACANVAHLQLVRASARGRELAIRAALGARRSRIVGQLLTESLLLTIVAAACGLGAAMSARDLLVALLPHDLPRVHAVTLDGRVLLYTLVAALGTVLVVGVAPALYASRASVMAGLRGGDRGSTPGLGRARSILLIAEVALAVVLLAGAGLLVRSFARVTAVDPGFDPGPLLVARLKVETRDSQLYGELRRRLEALPGVRGVTIAREMPYGRIFNSWNFTLDDRPAPPAGDPWWANAKGVDERYFQTLGIPLREGRGFQTADLETRPLVAVINETFARRYWPKGNALGHHVRAYDRDVEIVGVAADARGTCDQAGCAGLGGGRLDRAPEPEIFLPLVGVPTCYVAVRIAGPSPAPLVAPVRAALEAFRGHVVVTELRPMTAAIDQSLDHRRIVVSLLGAFAALAMLLAAVGIYGAVSFSVSQRTREIGVRMALGATSSVVRRMVVVQGLRPCLLGLGIGVAAALPLTRLLASQLFGVTPTDPATYAGIAALIAIVSALASLAPAWRATRVDPMVALRAD